MEQSEREAAAAVVLGLLLAATWLAVIIRQWLGAPCGHHVADRNRWASAGEREVGCALAELCPGHEWVKVRPDWLRNPATGRNLELDFYCEALHSAVEFNGAQHYHYSARFHRGTPLALEAQRARDALKMRRCAERGIRLLVIRYNQKNIPALLAQHLTIPIPSVLSATPRQ